MAVNAGELRNRMELLRRVKGENELGATSYHCESFDPPRKIWAKITPTAGKREELEGGMAMVVVTHRIECRRSAIPELTTDLRLRYRGQDYDVQYAYPNYQQPSMIDLYAKLVIEDGINGF